MTPREIRRVIKIAADACTTGDAETFASLFTTEGKILIAGRQIVGKAAIEKATADYLATRQEIQITLDNILVEDNQAVVEWTWEDTKIETGQRSRTNNAIVVQFKAGLICQWREYYG